MGQEEYSTYIEVMYSLGLSVSSSAVANPKDEPFTNKPIQFYEEMSLICGNDHATGKYTVDTHQPIGLEDIEEVMEHGTKTNDMMEDMDMIGRNDSTSSWDTSIQSSTRGPSESTSQGSKVKNKIKSGKKIKDLQLEIMLKMPTEIQVMDKNRGWMYNTSRVSAEYIEKVNDFLDRAFARVAKGNEICCPCRGCYNYYKWVFHGEDLPSRLNVHSESDDDDDAHTHDDVGGLLHDIFRGTIEEFPDNEEEGIKEGTEELSDDAKKFYKLVEEGQQELFPGCKTFSKLSFIIRLYLHKCIHGLSNEAFDDSLTLWREAIPDIKLPKSFYEAKRIVKDLGLDYEKIHACNVNGKLNECSSCGASRWKPTKDDVANDSNQPSKKVHNVPVKDGILRHPADGKAWKDFDEKHPEFALDPRNVRLGLSSDGFNPFRTMSIAHSTWPVILINYNLPPWMCLKAEYFMLSLLIPGPQSPGNNIDIYLQPLIDELKELWEVGLLTYDASIKQSFKLRVALLWTVSDFPGYAMLSGWSTKGRLACPYCNYSTCSEYLKYSKKMCYMDHRRFLKDDHPWRFNKRLFNGDIELGREPTSLSGTEIINELSNFVNEFGKKQKKRADRNCPWKKRSAFFDLPY
ncbi:uncharacterized protein LOC109838663 [Asparagus officinalis]|uniref:uncharacterized protein LOC109838663 n=1 Tax=Asparagus officinalis TaxID=4686 RepID=UPI00098DF708|nr:uncharacterized protein LOC109838663 [Asparagus officinalis]